MNIVALPFVCSNCKRTLRIQEGVLAAKLTCPREFEGWRVQSSTSVHVSSAAKVVRFIDERLR